MYNEELRSKLYDPSHYDTMIVLIMMHNPACADEDWAANVINICINSILKEDAINASCGMCMAKDSEEGIRLYLSVGVGISPSISPSVSRLAQVIRNNELRRDGSI